MLKGIDPLLGPELLMTLRAMGHGDEIAVVATGERRLHGNVILRKGVVRPIADASGRADPAATGPTGSKVATA